MYGNNAVYIETHMRHVEAQKLSVASTSRMAHIHSQLESFLLFLSDIPLRYQNSRFVGAVVPPVSLGRLTCME